MEAIGTLPPVLSALLAATRPEVKEAAWGAFVEVYTPLLLHTAYRFGRTYDGAMDRYTHLLEHLHRDDFRRLRAFAATGPGRFSTWLVVVARRLFLDYHRARYGRVRRPDARDGEESTMSSMARRNLAEMIGEDVRLSTIADWSIPNPEAAMHAKERAETVQTAVSSLEPRDQLLLKLRFDNDLAAQEIAEIMGFSTQFHVYRRLRIVLAVLGSLLPREYTEAIP